MNLDQLMSIISSLQLERPKVCKLEEPDGRAMYALSSNGFTFARWRSSLISTPAPGEPRGPSTYHDFQYTAFLPS